MKSWLLYLIGSLVYGLSIGVLAQQRAIPLEAQRGWIRHAQETVLSVDGKLVQLAPGGTIRNERNLIVVPASLPGNGALADFVLDDTGQLIRAWLLTPDEAARDRPRR